MSEPKTRPTGASVEAFLDAIPDEQMRADCRTIAGLMEKATKAKPRMWGATIVGFGTMRYQYAGGRAADWMLVAFSPRKQNITLYLTGGFEGRHELLSRLGSHSCGASCVYIKRLSDVHLPTLRKLITSSVRYMQTLTVTDPRFSSGKAEARRA
jgi:hypothetical protein